MRERIPPQYLDLRALAEYSSVSIRVWREILKTPDAPPCIRCRGKILLHKQDVDAYFQELKRAPGDAVGNIVGQVMANLTRRTKRGQG
jgi:hypothetical protein